MATANVYELTYRLRSFKLEVVDPNTGDKDRIRGAWGIEKTAQFIAENDFDARAKLDSIEFPDGFPAEDAERGQEIQVLRGQQLVYDAILALPEPPPLVISEVAPEESPEPEAELAPEST